MERKKDIHDGKSTQTTCGHLTVWCNAIFQLLQAFTVEGNSFLNMHSQWLSVRTYLKDIFRSWHQPMDCRLLHLTIQDSLVVVLDVLLRLCARAVDHLVVGDLAVGKERLAPSQFDGFVVDVVFHYLEVSHSRRHWGMNERERVQVECMLNGLECKLNKLNACWIHVEYILNAYWWTALLTLSSTTLRSRTAKGTEERIERVQVECMLSTCPIHVQYILNAIVNTNWMIVNTVWLQIEYKWNAC